MHLDQGLRSLVRVEVINMPYADVDDILREAEAIGDNADKLADVAQNLGEPDSVTYYHRGMSHGMKLLIKLVKDRYCDDLL